MNAEDVIHDYPLVFADTLPTIRGLASLGFSIDLLSMIVVEVIDLVRNHILDATRVFLCYVGHEITAIGHGTDVCIEHLDFGVWIFKQQFWFSNQCGEVFISIAIEEFGAPTVTLGSLTDGEIDHHLLLVGVPD